MKYLQDDQLAQWTSVMTEVPVGQSRVLYGRLEAYSMKRGSGDKKYAAVLGEKYVEQIQQDQQELAAAATSGVVPTLPSSLLPPPSGRRKRSQSESVTIAVEPKVTKQQKLSSTRRARSCSWDGGVVSAAARIAKAKSLSDLGDFNEQGTRRLMTDLVLTLNASFPDYDFGAIKPTDFSKMTVKKAVHRINESLSEWASATESRGGAAAVRLNQMWHDVDQCIKLTECDGVYTFKVPSGMDASFLLAGATGDAGAAALYSSEVVDVENGKIEANDKGSDTVAARMDDSVGGESSDQQPVLWSFCHLFVNKHQKRILLFSCAESIMRHDPTAVSDEEVDDDVVLDRYVQVVADDNNNEDHLDSDWGPENTNPAGGIPISTA